MAGSWAGAYGAGAASDELKYILTERLKQRMAAEGERANRAEETFRQQEAAAAQEREARREVLAREDAAERKRQFEASSKQHADDRRERSIERSMESQKRSMERADDREAGLEGEDRQRKFQREERMGRQQFEERMMRGRAGSSSDSEPLVAIADPTTGAPKLVPRSQAAGARPASTREQVMTEGQSNAAGFADRMKFNETPIQAYEGQIGRGTQLMGLLPGEMQSNAFRQYQAAKKNWIASQLRKESGAAISQGEYDEADRQYFPQPGDSSAVVKQKRDLRAVAEQSMRRASGTGAIGGGDLSSQQNAGGGPPRMTRTIRNPTTGETRKQTSLDGGSTWN